MKRSNRGLTLIEVLIASAIFAVMVLMALGFSGQTMNTANSTGRANELGGRGRLMLDRLREEISFARMTEAPGDPLLFHMQITYQAPIDANWTFGYRGVAGGFGRLRVVVREVLRENNGPVLPFGVPQTIRDVDVNRDGDRNDSFAVCRLFLESLDAGGGVVTSAAIDDEIILAPRTGNPGALDGDVDGDGIDDPLFRLEIDNGSEVTSSTPAALALGTRLQVTMFHGAVDPRGRYFLLRRNQDQIRLDQRQ